MFTATDQQKIQSKQRYEFEHNSKEILTHLKENFENRVKNSQQSRLLYESEIESLEQYLYKESDERLIPYIQEWKITFSIEQIDAVKKFINDHLIQGKEFNVDMILSPASKKEGKNYFISHALAMYNYHLWLKTTFLSNDKQLSLVERDKQNPFPSIFINFDSFLLFEQLKTALVFTKTQLADYSFIFHEMKNNSLLHPDISSKSFILFLEEKQGAKITATQLLKRNQPRHLKVFDAFFKIYKDARLKK